jgi:hypothetical protein
MFWFLPILPLFILALLPLSYSQEEIVRPGVSLEESRQIRFKEELWEGTPMTPAWKELLHRARQAGWRGSANGSRSGIRSHGQQKRFYSLWREGKGAPAFPPSGPSRHLRRNIRYWGQWSQAVDISRPKELIRVARKLGVQLHAPYDPEPWHIEARYAFSLPEEREVIYSSGTLLPLPIPISFALVLSGALLWRRGLRDKREREKLEEER